MFEDTRDFCQITKLNNMNNDGARRQLKEEYIEHFIKFLDNL